MFTKDPVLKSPMMEKTPQCVFVTGVECSGTRVVKHLFLANGWAGGEEHNESWGNLVKEYKSPESSEFPNIVWRFSFPMGEEIPRLEIATYLARLKGYEIICVAVVRDGYASQKHTPEEERAAQTCFNQVLMLEEMFRQIRIVNPDKTRVITYESLITFGVKVFKDLGLTKAIEIPVDFVDGNEKWYS